MNPPFASRACGSIPEDGGRDAGDWRTRGLATVGSAAATWVSASWRELLIDCARDPVARAGKAVILAELAGFRLAGGASERVSMAPKPPANRQQIAGLRRHPPLPASPHGPPTDTAIKIQRPPVENQFVGLRSGRFERDPVSGSLLRGRIPALRHDGPRESGTTHRGGSALLILTRKLGESVMIEESIRITVLEVRGSQVKLGIHAPLEVRVNREEVLERQRAEAGLPPLALPPPEVTARERANGSRMDERLHGAGGARRDRPRGRGAEPDRRPAPEMPTGRNRDPYSQHSPAQPPFPGHHRGSRGAGEERPGGRDEMDRHDTARGDPGRREIGRREIGRRETGRGDTGRNDIGRGDYGRGEAGSGELGRGGEGRGESGRREAGRDYGRRFKRPQAQEPRSPNPLAGRNEPPPMDPDSENEPSPIRRYREPKTLAAFRPRTPSGTGLQPGGPKAGPHPGDPGPRQTGAGGAPGTGSHPADEVSPETPGSDEPGANPIPKAQGGTGDTEAA